MILIALVGRKAMNERKLQLWNERADEHVRDYAEYLRGIPVGSEWVLGWVMCQVEAVMKRARKWGT